jgi:hypothetical protein
MHILKHIYIYVCIYIYIYILIHISRIMFTIGMNKRVRTDKELKDGIANFYDESSQVNMHIFEK